MSELVNSNVNGMKIERSSFIVCEEVCNPLSDARCDNESLHAAGMVGLLPKHKERNSYDVSGVAREIPPSEGGQDGTSLNVGYDLVGNKPKNSRLDPHNAREVIRENPLGKVLELRNSSPDGIQYMIYRIERALIYSNYGNPTVPASRRRKVSLTKQSRRRVATVKRQTSGLLRSDNSNITLYTIVNGMTSHVDGSISLETLSSLDTLFELDEMSDGEISQALKAGELSDLVVIPPDVKLNSSSLLDESVLEDIKAALNARSGSSVLQDPMDPFYHSVKQLQDVVCHEPPYVSPPDRGIRHKIDLVPGTNTA